MKLIAYLSNGYPSLDKSSERAIEFVESGVDVIEADFPAKDPYLDSDYLKNRIFNALKNDDNYDNYMNELLDLSKKLDGVEFLINIYPETLREIGFDKFAKFMDDLGQKEILLVGNTDPDAKKKLIEMGLKVSAFVTREMKQEDLNYASESNGFVYLEAFSYEDKNSDKYPELKDCLKKVRETIGPDRKIYCGVGIHNEELLKEVKEAGADGAFLGSIVLRKEDAGEDVSEYIRKLNKIAK